MKSLKGSRTEKNLLTAFAGESQARNRYTYFAKQAQKEGYEQIAAILLETADHEKTHAKRFFSFLEGGNVEILASFPAGVVATTRENLLAAAEGEHHEHTVMYPEFASTAEEEGFKGVAAAFRAISIAEAYHEKRYRKLLENIEGSKVFVKDEHTKWKCMKCGYVAEGKEAPQKCPSCDHPRAYFEIVPENY